MSKNNNYFDNAIDLTNIGKNSSDYALLNNKITEPLKTELNKITYDIINILRDTQQDQHPPYTNSNRIELYRKINEFERKLLKYVDLVDMISINKITH